MLTIRLARSGAKKRPFYHISVADSRMPRDGRFVERVGYYNPIASGQEVRLEVDVERIDYWISKGAQPSDRVLNLLKQNKLIFLIFIFFVFAVFWGTLLGFGTPIALLGGFIFGKWIGSLLVVFSLTTGSLCLYLIGKYFFYEFLSKRLHDKFSYLEKIFSKNELFIMIIFRFVGLVPFFIANLLPVIFNISIKNYYLGTLIGIFPAIFIMVSLGSGLSNIINTNETMPKTYQRSQENKSMGDV